MNIVRLNLSKLTCLFVCIVCNYSTVYSRTTTKQALNDHFARGNYATSPQSHGLHGTAHPCMIRLLNEKTGFCTVFQAVKFPSRLASTVTLCHSHTAICETRLLMLISAVGIVKNYFFHAITTSNKPIYIAVDSLDLQGHLGIKSTLNSIKT